jgi:protein ATS1
MASRDVYGRGYNFENAEGEKSGLYRPICGVRYMTTEFIHCSHNTRLNGCEGRYARRVIRLFGTLKAMRLLSAGSNARGQLANASLVDSHTFCEALWRDQGGNITTFPPPGYRVIDLSCGANHTVVLLERLDFGDPLSPVRELWGSGDGSRGQLGPAYLEETQDANSTTSVFRDLHLHEPHRSFSAIGGPAESYKISKVLALWETTVLLMSGPQWDIVLSVGSNDFGNLGIGEELSEERNGKREEVHIVSFDHLFDIWTPFRLAEWCCGPHHVVALLQFADESEKLVGWGACRHGQLGPVSSSSTSSSSGPPTFLNRPTFLSLPSSSNTLFTSAGNQHTVILYFDGHIDALGSNKKGQLNGLKPVSLSSRVYCTWNNTFLKVSECIDGKDRRRLLGTGSQDKGQLGYLAEASQTHSSELHEIQFPFDCSNGPDRLACGSEHVIALFRIRTLEAGAGKEAEAGKEAAAGTEMKVRKEVWGWGWNEHGNFGLGHTKDLRVPTKIWPPAGASGVGTAVNVWAGCGTSWILVEKEEV